MLNNVKSMEQLKELINSSTEGIKLEFKVNANSKKNSIEFLDDFIKLKISKPALDGKANAEIIKFLSEILNLPKKNIKILNGEKSSKKLLLFLPETLQ